MPLGKYHCDYCDKQFQDTPAARKRHLQGLQHQRAKAIWYHSLKEPNQILPESFNAGVCNRFVRTGNCQYGDSCKYYHPKPDFQMASADGIVDNTVSRALPGSQSVGGSSSSGYVIGGAMEISRGNLPPSLQPPPEGGYPPLPFLDWG